MFTLGSSTKKLNHEDYKYKKILNEHFLSYRIAQLAHCKGFYFKMLTRPLRQACNLKSARHLYISYQTRDRYG